MRFALGAFACLLLASSSAWGELPAPRLDRIMPLGAAAGSTIELEVAGGDLEGVSKLHFAQQGITAEPIADKEKWFRVTVPSDCPPGTYDCWAIGQFGISSPRLFSVTTGLTDITEAEPNNNAQEAGVVPLNVAINGRSDGNNQDLFRFHAEQGQRITLTCQAGLLDSELDAVMTITTVEGKSVAANSDYYGRDPFIDFVVPSTADYLVVINDLSYRGGHAYRLLISTLPQIENVFPRALRAKESTELTVLGRNLGSAAKPSSVAVTDALALDQISLPLTANDSIADQGLYRFSSHPTDHTVVPTAATCTVVGWQPHLTIGGVPIVGVPLVVTQHATSIEVEPNDSAEKPQAIELPVVLSGQFQIPRDSDWFEFMVPEKGSYEFNVYCERIAGRADPYLVIMDEEGKRITEHDDYGHRVNAFDGHLRDPWGITNLNAEKKYRVMVQDRYGRGGARYQYVLTIEKCQADFFAASIHSERQQPAGFNLRRGGATHLDVVIHQRGEYRGPVEIRAENLPAGVHARPVTINNTNRGAFVVWADADAPETIVPIKLIATGLDGERKFEREVRPYTRVSNRGNSSRPTRQRPLSVLGQAPFMLRLEPPTLEATAGEKVKVELAIERHWHDFKSEVSVLSQLFPNNFKLPTQKISGDQRSITLEIEVQANTQPGQYTLAVIGQAQVPFNKDPEAKDRSNTLVSQPSSPVTILVKEAPK